MTDHCAETIIKGCGCLIVTAVYCFATLGFIWVAVKIIKVAWGA
jgi:hypothetical protein